MQIRMIVALPGYQQLNGKEMALENLQFWRQEEHA